MYFLFDIGGTKTRLAVSSDGRTFRAPQIFSTPRRFEDGLRRIRLFINGLGEKTRFRSGAGGIAGPIDRARGILVNAPHLRGWVRKPLKAGLERMLRVPVSLENDAALAGLGEATAGAGRGRGIVAYVTVGTGVNGARIVDGRIDRSAAGFEIGHQFIVSGGPRCSGCG